MSERKPTSTSLNDSSVGSFSHQPTTPATKHSATTRATTCHVSGPRRAGAGRALVDVARLGHHRCIIARGEGRKWVGTRGGGLPSWSVSDAWPLAGTRVVDLSSGLAGAYCTKLLADGGAEVVKVEDRSGDPLRRESESGAPIADGEDGAFFRFLSTSKDSVVASASPIVTSVWCVR